MAEVIHDFGLVRSSNGSVYRVRACGSPMDASRWQGWLEFDPVNGGEALRSTRETTQPNRVDLVYWATGLTAVYLEGALNRTLNPLVRPVAPPVAPPVFDGPAPPARHAANGTASVLNPFSVYRKGEALLRDQLAALSAWHLVNIVLAYDLSEVPVEQLNRMPAPTLIETIVTGVRTRAEEGVTESSR
jgi:hypothetical protein